MLQPTAPRPAAPLAMGRSEWALLVLLSVFWGGSFFFIEIAVGELPPFTVVLARVSLAALAMTAVVRLAGQRLPSSPRVWRDLLVLGLINNAIPFSLIVWGQTRMGAGLAAVLNATTPLFTVAIAHWATGDERLTTARIAGVLFGIAGVAVLLWPAGATGFDGDALASLAILGAALCYAGGGVFGRRFRRLPATVIANGQLVAATLLITPVALAVDRPWTLALPSAAALAAVVALALVSTALSYVIYFRILATAGATNLALVTFLVPVSALLLGVGVLDERLQPADVAGMALIAAGLAAIDGRPWRILLGWRPFS